MLFRSENMVPAEAMPFTGAGGMRFDNGDYPESVAKAAAAVGMDDIRTRQEQSSSDGKLIGVGFASYSEQTAHGTQEWKIRGTPVIPAFETATARMHADGTLELLVAIHSHGQGMETSMAQVAHEVLGIDPDNVTVTHGDTGLTPYSTGTWGSRCMVMSGGAVATACEAIGERAARIGASLLQAEVDDVRIEGGEVIAPGGTVSLAEIARVWYLKPQDLPPDVDPAGLEVTVGYKPERDTGTFSYAAHAAVVRDELEVMRADGDR